MALAALALLISLATGGCLLERIWPRTPGRTGEDVLRVAVAIGLGLWISSCVCLLALELGRPALQPLLDLTVLAAALLWWRRGRRGEHPQQSPLDPAPDPAPLLARGAGIGLVAAALLGLLSVVRSYASAPFGWWDAWAIWNLKARFFHLESGEHWRRAFSDVIAWSHPDYPLLVPLNVARLWNYAGAADSAIPAILSGLFAIATVAAVFGALRQLRGFAIGAIGALTLIATPAFLEQASWQMADLPVGCFLLSSVSLILLATSGAPRPRGLLVTAGWMAGAAAWTKNEGSLMALVSLGALALFGSGAAASRRRSVRLFGLGLFAPLVLLLFMKLTLAGRSDLLIDPSIHWMMQVFDWNRHQAILSSFGSVAADLVGLPLAVTLALLAFGLRPMATSERRATAIAASIPLMLLGGYYLIYLITPRDLEWQLATSNQRLFLQLWPSLILVFFGSLRPPEVAPSLHVAPGAS